MAKRTEIPVFLLFLSPLMKGVKATLSPRYEKPFQRFLKRLFDIVVSGLFLILAYPLVWLVCAIGIKSGSPGGPILFRQKRTGLNNKEFTILKFRSMALNDEADTHQAIQNDKRVFPFGEFIRHKSIDELPQFINVLKGDMSIIGPRPLMLYHSQLWSERIAEFPDRYMVKPGITGWTQVNNTRGEVRCQADMQRRVDLDLWYVENWSLGLDMKVFFLTVKQLFHDDANVY